MRDITLGDTIYMMFSTRQFSTGAPFLLAGTPAVSAYENESLTQITAGITLGADHDNLDGLNLITVVASSGNGYEVGKDYNLVITAGTVDGVSVVGEVVGQFSIQRSAAAADLANGTDGLGAIKAETAAILADTSVIGATGAGLTSLATQASVDTIDNLLDTEMPALTTAVADIPTVAEFEARTIAAATYATAANLATVAGYLDTEIAAILADTNELQTDWADGGRLDLILDARSSQASVDDIPTNAELTTALGTADDAVLTAIAALNNFDPAATEVLANIKKVNDVEITGDGSGTPWGPA